MKASKELSQISFSDVVQQQMHVLQEGKTFMQKRLSQQRLQSESQLTLQHHHERNPSNQYSTSYGGSFAQSQKGSKSTRNKNSLLINIGIKSQLKVQSGMDIDNMDEEIYKVEELENPKLDNHHHKPSTVSFNLNNHSVSHSTLPKVQSLNESQSQPQIKNLKSSKLADFASTSMRLKKMLIGSSSKQRIKKSKSPMKERQDKSQNEITAKTDKQEQLNHTGSIFNIESAHRTKLTIDTNALNASSVMNNTNYFLTQSQGVLFPNAHQRAQNGLQSVKSATNLSSFILPRQELSKLTIQENSQLISKLSMLTQQDKILHKNLEQQKLDSKLNIKSQMEVMALEKINQKVDLMQQTKEEMRKTFSYLNKIIVKKDAFKVMHHLVGNKLVLKPNEAQYLKLFVNSKPAPLNIQIQKTRNEQSFNIIYSRTNPMPDLDDNNGEYQNPSKFQIQDRHEMVFKNQYIFFTLSSFKGCEIVIYAYFNKEKPLLAKNGSNSQTDLQMVVAENKKTNSKYKYINRINEILNDDLECDEVRREAIRIKNRRMKEALIKAQSNRLNYDKQLFADYIAQRPSQMSVENYKLEKAQERKTERDNFHLKKNIFLLNRQEILKEYREKALKDAKELRKKKDLCKQWNLFFVTKSLFVNLFEHFKLNKEQYLLKRKQKDAALRIERVAKIAFQKYANDLRKRNQIIIKKSFTSQVAFIVGVAEMRAWRNLSAFLQHTTDQNNIINRFRKFAEKIMFIQKAMRIKLTQHRERTDILHKKWDICLDQLKFEYLEDKEEKDRHSQNIFRNMKLLGDEAKKREIKVYYNFCKIIYDNVYYDWRDLTKTYHENEMMQRQPSGPIRNIVEIWQSTAKINNKQLKIYGKQKYSIHDEFLRNENNRHISLSPDTKKQLVSKSSKKKGQVVSFYGRYLSLQLDHEKEIERLYQDDENEEINIRFPPKLKFIPSDTFIKCLILKYVDSTLF